MTKIERIEDIETIIVHWSESKLINDELGGNDGDIEKEVDPVEFSNLILRASSKVKSGFDKTNLSIKLKHNIIWCEKHKFYITNSISLLKMINGA